MLRIGIATALIIGIASLAYFAWGLGEQTVVVGKHWPEAERIPMNDVDHGPWDELLAKYVDQAGRVDYAAWHRDATDREALRAYLSRLSRAKRSTDAGRETVLAFWINAYNALTIEGILREYPTDTIRNHTPALVGYHIWHDLKLPVDSETYSLSEIEHAILRKLHEPRIHFAIVCASAGCPRLLNEAYTPEHLESQLAKNTKLFFADESKFAVDTSTKTIYVSQIFEWFPEDFGDDVLTGLRSLKPYLPDSAMSLLADDAGSIRVEILDYDWSLNDQSQGPSPATPVSVDDVTERSPESTISGGSNALAAVTRVVYRPPPAINTRP